MATIKNQFKDYEIGFYGFVGSFGGQWMQWQGCHNYIHGGDGKVREIFDKATIEVFKQLPKLKDVVFIYGDYKETI